MKIDNFALTMFQSCPRKYDLRMRQGWTIRRRAPALSFGAAIHSGLAVWYTTGSIEQSVDRIAEVWTPTQDKPDDHRTLEKCVRVMVEYSQFYPTENFSVVGMPDTPMVERTFTLALGMHLACPKCGSIADPESPNCPVCTTEREPIEYGGIFDTLVETGGQMYVLEHKTTSMLGPFYFNQYKPNNQITGYVWAAQEMSGQKVSGALINAIGVYKVGATKFERQVTTRNPQEIAEWKRNVWATCLEIQQYEKMQEWPQRTNSCTQYGLCEFHSVCTLSDHRYRENRLNMDYTTDRWDYANRDDKSV